MNYVIYLFHYFIEFYQQTENNISASNALSIHGKLYMTLCMNTFLSS